MPEDCHKCDELEAAFIRPRTERSMRQMYGALAPELSEKLDAEEMAALRAIQDHKMAEHYYHKADQL
jgi:hypothetical protein